MGQKYIFLHIPKTAGTTLQGVLRKALNEDELQLKNRNYPIEIFNNKTRQQKDKVKIIKGHITFGVHNDFDSSYEYKYISLLRDPILRYASLFFHMQKDEGHPLYKNYEPTKEGFMQYLESDDGIKNQNIQTKLIAGTFDEKADLLDLAIKNIKNHFVLVGQTEKFREFVKKLAKEMNWKNIPKIQNKNVGTSSKYSEILVDDVLKIMKEKNKIDYDLIEFTKSYFN